jgi:molybdopterin-guanine dinucleotide biosynthesis protein A/molybdopterin converting factor small subunit
MGQPKALLSFDDEPLIIHTVRTLRRLFSDIVVVAAPEQELPSLSVTLVHDEVAYQGPVGGILYGLRVAQSEIAFVTSCDAPFLNLELITFLVAQMNDYDVVVPYWQERLQPLHAVYRRSVAPLLQEQLERGELRPIFLYKKVRTREVSPEEIRRFDPEGLSFRNMNSPEDYQAALGLWQKKRQTDERETERAPSLSAPQPGLLCTVELFGVARLKAKTATVPLVLPEEAQVQDALAALAEAVPALVGSVLTLDRHALVNGYICNVNGTEFTRDWQYPLRSGDHLLILSSDAGG